MRFLAHMKLKIKSLELSRFFVLESNSRIEATDQAENLALRLSYAFDEKVKFLGLQLKSEDGTVSNGAILNLEGTNKMINTRYSSFTALDKVDAPEQLEERINNAKNSLNDLVVVYTNAISKQRDIIEAITVRIATPVDPTLIAQVTALLDEQNLSEILSVRNIIEFHLDKILELFPVQLEGIICEGRATQLGFLFNSKYVFDS